ncbi:hypothetical protein P872_01975 [Rhodonellum psychrophilum GCM71 = DSM 17998]|uniref:Uncharacterized protein n=1 Tax=Rhodonellum psychrophilum GCM71 = DSM 17998 TaxID=1123057 RepID=U5C6I2_9BACT|nr:hypothetical protein P872_01975 [Rhodonellum psychrophilum GCM71 = DSM 17998]
MDGSPLAINAFGKKWNINKRWPRNILSDQNLSVN